MSYTRSLNCKVWCHDDIKLWCSIRCVSSALYIGWKLFIQHTHNIRISKCLFVDERTSMLQNIWIYDVISSNRRKMHTFILPKRNGCRHMHVTHVIRVCLKTHAYYHPNASWKFPYLVALIRALIAIDQNKTILLITCVHHNRKCNNSNGTMEY